MPEGLIDTLSPDQIANLLAFVSAAGAGEMTLNRCAMRNPQVATAGGISQLVAQNRKLYR